jgi:hypothetical protein
MPKGKPVDVTASAPAEFWDKADLPAESTIFGWGQLRIIHTKELIDNEDWIHVSLSCRNRFPTWDELLAVRYEFFLETDEVIQIFPPKKEYINHHKYALHLWHCNDRTVLPLRTMVMSL